MVRTGKKASTTVDSINNGLAKLPGYEGVVGRGQSFVGNGQWEKWKRGEWGQVWWTCPSSSSAAPDLVFRSGTQGVCYIVRTKGKRNAWVQDISYHQSEHEALFMGDSAFHVVGYAESKKSIGGHYRFLVVDELPEGAVAPTKQAAPPKLNARELWDAFNHDAREAGMPASVSSKKQGVNDLLEKASNQ